MITYWLMFLPAAAGALYVQRRIAAGSSTRVLELGPVWWLVVLLLTLLIGYRFEVGGDWGSYMNYLYRAEYSSFAQMMTLR
jgi:hypothetical protein